MKIDRNILNLIITLAVFVALIFAGVANLSSAQKRCDAFLEYADSCMTACANDDSVTALETLDEFRKSWDSQSLYLAAIFEHTKFESVEVSLSLAKASLIYNDTRSAYTHLTSLRQMIEQLKDVEAFELENIL